MRYFCTDCSYIFDEANGEKDLWVEPWIKFEEMLDFYCPNCEAESDMFQPIVEEILYADDSKNLQWLERTHIPHILYMDEKEIEVSIGEEYHPMDEEHRIAILWLYDEDEELIEEYFFSVDEEPVYSFDIWGLANFEIRAYCNEHGVWSTGVIKNIS